MHNHAHDTEILVSILAAYLQLIIERCMMVLECARLQYGHLIYFASPDAEQKCYVALLMIAIFPWCMGLSHVMVMNNVSFRIWYLISLNISNIDWIWNLFSLMPRLKLIIFQPTCWILLGKPNVSHNQLNCCSVYSTRRYSYISFHSFCIQKEWNEFLNILFSFLLFICSLTYLWVYKIS